MLCSSGFELYSRWVPLLLISSSVVEYRCVAVLQWYHSISSYFSEIIQRVQKGAVLSLSYQVPITGKLEEP